jgi:hypothetical protein
MIDPSSAELGMLRAAAQSALDEAWRYGLGRAEFHNFHITACRTSAVRHLTVPVELIVSCEGLVVERGLAQVSAPR